jgi:hypothetical protein
VNLLLLFPASIFSSLFYLLTSQSPARRPQPHDSFWCTLPRRTEKDSLRVAKLPHNRDHEFFIAHRYALAPRVEIRGTFAIHQYE